MKTTPENRKKRAFTLTEVLVAMTIATVALAMIMDFSLENLKISLSSELKNQTSFDTRRFNRKITDDGKQSSYFRLYRSFNTADRQAASDHLGESNSGDFVLFVYLGEPDGSNLSIRPIERIVGYFRDVGTAANSADLAPMRSFDIDISPASTDPVETLIPSAADTSTYAQVAADTLGTVNGNVFYNFWNRSVMVSGQIRHGNNNKNVTEAYNFTVTPRG